MQLDLKVKILRNARVQTYPFTDYFQGFENVEVVNRIFGDKTKDVIRNLKVEFSGSKRAYMGVSEVDGHLLIGAPYLSNGDIVDIYLDIIHELVHVRQFMEGKELFESRYDYVERPTEVEAYGIAVEEARRLGLDDKRICQYLKTEWMTDQDLKQLARALNVKCEK